MKMRLVLLAGVAAMTLSGAALAQRGLDPEIAKLKLEPNIIPGCRVLGRPVAAPPAPGQILETRPPSDPAATRAFKEQTRAVYVKSKTAVSETVIAKGLVRAWKIMFLPDGRMLISERPGAIRIVTQKGEVGQPIAGVPTARTSDNPQGTVLNFSDAGFLDVVLDPAFAQNRKIYWSFVELRADGNGLTVQSATLSPDEKSFGDIHTIFSAPSWKNAGHYGGKMMIDHSGKLLVSVGERIDDEVRIKSQAVDSPLGKLLRMNLDGGVPDDNPVAKLAKAEGRIWASGLRNVEGLAYDAKGRLWASDIGPQTADEINLIEKGHNYGWPLASYGLDYCGQPPNGGATAYPGTDQPIYYWDPTTAPAGITFYDGRLVPEWKGNLFVAQLAGSHVARLILNGKDRVVGEERLLQSNQQRVRDIEEGPDGALWALTDAPADGRLIRIAPPGK